MKKIALTIMLLASISLLAVVKAQAGEVDVLIFKLVEKGVLSPAEAQIIVDETKMQVSKDLAQGKSLSVPDWTQRIKWGGDVRFRTQGDWGKGNRPTGSTPPTILNQRIRNRVRGRFYMEGKVNDFTYAGVRFAGGANGSRSTNDTLGATSGTSANYFQKAPAYFDQYYIRFEAPSEVVRDYGQFFSDAKLLFGRFAIPFETSELMWDTDINPAGIAVQYVSPDIKTGMLPDMNVYSNLGMFWLDESGTYNDDPILWGYQVGVKTDVFGPLGSVVNVATSWYDFANMQGKNATPSASSANTNTRNWLPDGTYNRGAYRYAYNVFDLLINIDNSKVMDFDFPHGFYADFAYNPSAPAENQGTLVGAYIGKKKLKMPGDWKARAEWRYIERDAVPDFMPDSDFYGFGTWASTTSALDAGNNGLPVEGGTNGKGINLALDYQLLKNTTVSLEYYWMKPIKSWDKTQPWNECQFDIVTKF